MKVCISCRDDNFVLWEEFSKTPQQINRQSYELSNRFLSPESELYKLLNDEFYLLPSARLVFTRKKENKDGSTAAMKMEIVPHAHSQTPMTPRLEDFYARINQFTAEYFRERGLPTIEPSTPDEVLAFARWMLANAPEMEGYITIED